MPDPAADAATAAARAAAAAGGPGSGANGGDGQGGAKPGGGANAADAAAAAAAAARGSGDVWGDQWREAYAKGADGKPDEGKLNVLKRYDSGRSLLDAHFALRQRLDSGELRARLPDNATAEQIAAYNRELGVPEKPEGYWEGIKPELLADITDGDRAMLTPYLDFAQKQHVPPALLHGFIALRQAEQDRQVDARVAADLALKKTTEDALRADWGKDYGTNLGVIHAVLESAPEDLRNDIMNARTPSGDPLFGSPEMNRWFAQLARNLVDVGAILPGNFGGGDEGGKSLEGRLKEINGWMAAPKGSADYNKYWNDAAVQAEYRDLIDRQDAIKRRARAA